MTEGRRSAAVVLDVSADAPPAGIAAAEEIVDLRYARDAVSLRAQLPGAEALLYWRAVPGVLEEAWDAATELRWIQSASAGLDALLFPALVGSDVDVTNARGVFDDGIAEWVVGVMLAFTSGLQRSIEDRRDRRWDHERHTEHLAGKRLVIVGPGPIGRGSGRRALALGMDVMMVGRSGRDDRVFGRIVGPDRLLEMVGEADFVLDALPLTATTRGLIDARVFASMKPTARFLNVGRGDTVDEDALIEALGSGAIAGAALDVFRAEPLPDASPLWTLPGVIVSPHISGDVQGWEAAVVDLFIENARRWVAGEALVNLVDKRAGHG